MENNQPSEKKEYTTPKLTEFGLLAEITKGLVGSVCDADGGGSNNGG